MNRTSLFIVSLMLVAVVGGGCARASLDTTGFEKVDSATVNAEFMKPSIGDKVMVFNDFIIEVVKD